MRISNPFFQGAHFLDSSLFDFEHHLLVPLRVQLLPQLLLNSLIERLFQLLGYVGLLVLLFHNPIELDTMLKVDLSFFVAVCWGLIAAFVKQSIQLPTSWFIRVRNLTLEFIIFLEKMSQLEFDIREALPGEVERLFIQPRRFA